MNMPLSPSWQEISVRLALTLIAGAIIGFNRGARGLAAGFRTTILVGLAASVAMIQTNILLPLAGKTGTATNPHGPAHSWFVAFAPAHAPRVVVAVIVENGGYGAAVAAPIVRDVLRVALARTRT